MKIKPKLTLAFLLASLVPLVVLGVFSYVNARETVTNGVLNQLQSVAVIQKHRVESIVSQNLERLALVSSRTQLRISLDSYLKQNSIADQERMNTILLDARSSIKDFEEIYVLNLDGEVVASTSETMIGSLLANEGAFIRGRAEENSGALLFLDETGELKASLSGPLYLEDEPIGVVVIRSSADNILSVVGDYTGLGKTGETSLAKRNEDGDALFLTPLRFDPEAKLHRTMSLDNLDSPTVQALLGNEGLFTDAVDYRGEPVLAAAQYIPEVDWGLVAKIDEAEAFAPVTRLHNLTALTIGLAAALVVIVSLYLARNISKPIQSLARVADKIREGDVSQRAEVVSSDEIGMLAQHFNDMTEDLVRTNNTLRSVNSALKTLSECNQILVRATDESTLLKGVCRIIVTHGGYRGARVGLVDPGDETTVRPVAEAWHENGNCSNHDVAWPGEEDYRVIFMEAVNTGKPQVLKGIHNNASYVHLSTEANERGYESLIALPLSADGQASGVLFIYSAEAGPFDKDEVKLLTELADDLAYGIRALRMRVEREQAEERITHLSDVLRAIRNVNQLITHEKDRELLIQETCDILIETRGYERAWILFLDEHGEPLLAATSGLGDESTAFMERIKAGKYPQCVNELLAQKSPFLAFNHPGQQHQGCIQARSHEAYGTFRAKLEHDGRLYGLLGVTVVPTSVSDNEEQDLFMELAKDVAFALATIETEENRQRVEEKLRRSEVSLAEAQRIAHVGSWDWDILKNEVSYSDEFHRMFGRRITNLDAFLDSLHPDDREFVEKSVNEAMYKNRPYDIEYRVILPNGAERVIHAQGEVTFNNTGKSVRIVGTVQDISEHKLAESALKASEEKLRLMFKSVPEGITLSDLDGNILETNEAAVKMHGYDSKEELIGGRGFELIAEEDRSRAMENLRETLEKGHSPTVEYTFLRKDGSEFPAELTAALLRDGAGNPVGFIAVTRDITERRKMEEQLILTDRLASIGELASGVAHELNNPLTGVIGLSQLLTQRDVPEDIKEDLNLVYSEAQRAANVVKNLLTFARKHSPAKELININDAISKVLELRAYEERVSNIEVVIHLAPDLPQIMADYFQLQQVFLNIVINAEYFMIEAHNKGTLTITTERAGDGVRTSFTDDGPGIPREDLGHIFDPFFTTKEVGKGTGLGLSICHGIISAHNGRIYAESEPGKGTTFIVELPLSQEEIE